MAGIVLGAWDTAGILVVGKKVYTRANTECHQGKTSVKQQGVARDVARLD